MAIPETLGERLRQAMKEAGVRNAEVARVADVHVKTVSYWLNGRFEPEDDVLERIAPLLKRSKAWLRYGAEDASSLIERASALRKADERSMPPKGLPLAVAMPNALRLRQNEVERELIEIGATDEEVADFRRSVRDNPLLAALFRGGAPERLSNEEMLQLFDGVAEGFKAIIQQLVKERAEAKRRG